MITLNLPRPPSVNEIYRNVPGVGRVKSSTYKKWIDAAGWMLKSQRPGKLEGRYKLLVLIGPTRADIGNLEKALSDLLQSHGVVSNDNKADSILLERSADIPAQQIRCHVMTADTWVPLSDAVASILASLKVPS